MPIVVCLYTDDCSDCTGTVMDDIAVLRQLVCCLGPQLFWFCSYLNHRNNIVGTSTGKM